MLRFPFSSPVIPPTSGAPATDMPRVSATYPERFLPVGSVSSTSRDNTFCVRTFCVSTTGAAVDTMTVSSTDPTLNSAFTGAVKPAVNSMPSRRTGENPGSVNVTVYVPGRSSMTLYRPSASVTTLRTFSISVRLDASTVTPGRTAPVVSRTTPVMPPVTADCAQALLVTLAQNIEMSKSRVANRARTMACLLWTAMRFLTEILYSLRRNRIAVLGRAKRATKILSDQSRALPGYQGQSPWLVKVTT